MTAPSQRSHLRGIFLMCKASVGFSIMALCVKWASQTLPSLEIVFFRSLIGCVMILIVLQRHKISVFGTRERWRMILRGITGFIALSLHFYTIAHLPLGTAVMLNYTGPIFAALFAVMFLKEKLSLFLSSMILLSFSGVYLLVGAQLHPFNLMIFLGLLSAVFVGMVYVLIRSIAGRQSAFTIIFYFTMVSTAGSAFYLPFGFQWPTLFEWLILAGIGIGSFYGQWWMTLSLSLAPASLVSPFSYLTPLLSFLYGLFLFGEKLTPFSVLGAFLIVVSGSIISYAETKREMILPTDA